MIKYLFRRIASLRPQKIFYNVRKTAEEANMSPLFIFFDMVFCFFRYGAGYIDYRAYSFYHMTPKLRETYFSRTSYRNFILKVCDATQSQYFDNKALFDTKFEVFLHRGFLDLSCATRKKLEKFLTFHGKRYFVKPTHGEGGKGIWVLNLDEYTDIKDAIDAVMGKKDYVIEEAIIQHESMSRLNPDSVNCLRIMTFIDDNNEAVPVSVMLKIGLKGRFTDNSSMYINLDYTTGITNSVGFNIFTNGDTNVYKFHPDYGYDLCGLHIPYTTEAVNLALLAAQIVPQVRLVGWDIAITQNGPIIIEGNTFPGQWDSQYFLSQSNNEGLKSILRKHTKLL